MPWRVAKTDACPKDKPWGVVPVDGGEVRGCHTSRESALKQMQALNIKFKNGEISSWEKTMNWIIEQSWSRLRRRAE